MQQQVEACDILADDEQILALLLVRQNQAGVASTNKKPEQQDVSDYFSEPGNRTDCELALAYAAQYAAIARCLVEQLSDIAHPLCRIKNKFCEVAV